MSETEYQKTKVGRLRDETRRARGDILHDIDMAARRTRRAMTEHFHRLHAGLTRRARDLLSEMLGSHRVLEVEHPSLGSEDFSRFVERVPGLLLRLGCTAEGQHPYPLHSSHFKVDEAALDTGVRAMCRLALD